MYFDWFVSTFDELNKPMRATDISSALKESIDMCRARHTKYSDFIEDVSLLLNISDTDKERYLSAERHCTKCKIEYPMDHDPLVSIIHDSKDIAGELCESCCHKLMMCDMCGYTVGGPYEKFYLGNTLLCESCWQKELI
jgi:hypothetical protein